MVHPTTAPVGNYSRSAIVRLASSNLSSKSTEERRGLSCLAPDVDSSVIFWIQDNIIHSFPHIPSDLVPENQGFFLAQRLLLLM